jgi:hypothetical protein
LRITAVITTLVTGLRANGQIPNLNAHLKTIFVVRKRDKENFAKRKNNQIILIHIIKSTFF